MRDENQVAILKELIRQGAKRLSGGIIGLIGAAFMLIKGDNFDIDDFSRRAKRAELNFPAPTTLTMAATTAWADGTWTLTNEKDRYRLLLNVGIIHSDLDEATGLGDGVLHQLHQLAYIQTKRTTGRAVKESYRRYSLGCIEAEADGLTTLVASSAPQQALANLLLPDPLEVAVAKAIDAQAPNESTEFDFQGINAVTVADSASGIQGSMIPVCLDAVMGS